MNTRCTICHHVQRAEIEAAHAGGMALRKIAEKFGPSRTTLSKHWRSHVADAAQKAIEAGNAREIDAGGSILAEVDALKNDAKRLQAQAERKKDIRAALIAIDKLMRLAELQARLLGELRDREISITNVQVDPETLDRMAEMHLARRAAAKPAKPDTVGPVAAIAAPSTLTVDVIAGCLPVAGETSPASSEDSE